MRLPKSIIYFAVILWPLFSGCSEEHTEKFSSYTVNILKAPTIAPSSEPNLYRHDENNVYLTWIEEDSTLAKLFLSEFLDNEWTSAKLIAQGDNWFVNWADFPSVTHFAENSIVANYLVQSAPDTYSYDVHLCISNDHGESWEIDLVPHNDDTKTEHGFVSLVPWGRDFMAVWLDGRKYSTGQDEMTLRAALISQTGDIIDEYLIDDRVCDCCPTNAVETENGIAVVYRNRSQNEIRDINVVLFDGENWSAPRPIHNDNWEIAGCPVNGPAIDAVGRSMAIAWFTAAGDSSLVNVVISHDGGNSFQKRQVVSSSGALGRVDVCMDERQNCFVSWMEESTEGSNIKVRKISADGTKQEPWVVSGTSASRTSGMPKMTLFHNELLFAWTEVGDHGTQIKTAKAQIPEGP